MAYIVDSGGNHAYIDGVEAVTYQPKETGEAAITAVQVKRGSHATAAAIFGDSIALTPEDVVFCLWTDTLSGRAIRKDDTLTDTTSRAYRVRLWKIDADESQAVLICRKNAT
jgi:hypothetical protein